MMNEKEQLKKLEELLSLPNETEWVELKTAKSDYDFEKLGKYLSAISNEANLHNEAAGWIIFGADKSHRVVVPDLKKQDPN